MLDIAEHLQLPVLFALMQRLSDHIKPAGSAKGVTHSNREGCWDASKSAC